jgi:hypothetical protein
MQYVRLLFMDLDQMQDLVACMTHPSSTYTTVNIGVSALIAAKASFGYMVHDS